MTWSIRSIYFLNYVNYSNKIFNGDTKFRILSLRAVAKFRFILNREYLFFKTKLLDLHYSQSKGS